MYILLLLCLSCSSALALLSDYRPIRYRDCSELTVDSACSLAESNFQLLSVEAAGCPGTTNYCPFKRGSEPKIRIVFKPKTSVRAKLGMVFVPFNLDENNPCVGGNLTCPLKQGHTYYYTQSVKILHEYPLVNDVQINWLLNDKSNDVSENDVNKREACIIFKAKVVD